MAIAQVVICQFTSKKRKKTKTAKKEWQKWDLRNNMIIATGTNKL